MFSADLLGQLKKKDVVFDTCLLSTIKNNVEVQSVSTFLQVFSKQEASIIVNDFIAVEFLRDANKESELIGRKAFLETLCESFSVPSKVSMYTDAQILSYIYAANRNQGIGLIDLFTSVILKQYAHSNRIVLATINNKDFPLSVHNRIGTVVLDLGKDLSVVGFYSIDLEKWNAKVQELLSSTQWDK